MVNKDWSLEEEQLALALYVRSQTKVKERDMEHLGAILDRTRGSVSRKIGNLISLDPNNTSTGLINASKNDREIWRIFNEDPVGFMSEADELLNNYNSIPTARDELKKIGNEGVEFLDTVIDEMPLGHDREAIVKVRQEQLHLRNAVLMYSKGTCNVTGIACNDILVASHIKPWKDSTPFEKTDVHNVLCLNRFHDGLFDRFRMTVVEKEVIYDPKLKEQLGKEFYNLLIENYGVLKYGINKYNEPRQGYLEYHNHKFEEKCGVSIKNLI